MTASPTRRSLFKITLAATLASSVLGAAAQQAVSLLNVFCDPTRELAVVGKNVDRKGTRAVAQAYLKYLYTDEGQDIAGRNFYRPISEKFQAKYVKQLPKISLFRIKQAFGGWAKADKEHFADGASFDQICSRK